MSVTTTYSIAADIDVQPLDLSIRPRREHNWPLQNSVMENEQAYLTSTCICDMASGETEHVSHCFHPANSNICQPHVGLLSSLLSNTDSTFYTLRHAASPNSGFKGNHQRKSPYHLLPRRKSEINKNNSQFQQLSGNADKDVCTSYDCDIECSQHPDWGVYSQPQKSSSLTPSLQEHTDHHSCAMPHPSAATPLAVTSGDCQSGNSPIMYSQWRPTEAASLHRRNVEKLRNIKCDLYNPAQNQAAYKDTIYDPLGEKSTVRHEVAWGCREKLHQICPGKYSPDSQQTSPEDWQDQLCHPDSPAFVSSSTPDPWNVNSNNASTPFSNSKPTYQSKNYSHLHAQPREGTHLEIHTQQLSSYPGSPQLNNSAMPSLSSKDNTPRKDHAGCRPASVTPSDCDQVSTSTDAVCIMDNKKPKQFADANLHHRQVPDNLLSTQVSILDFWISKFLWERSLETTSRRKPCHVEYISENGQEKIRFRLIDLIELQVEQSLKA